MYLKISKRNRIQETIEKETGIDPTAEVGIILETTTEMVVETTMEIEVEIAEIETEVEEETDLIQEREEETNLDLDQVKDILKKVRLVVSAIEVDT